MHVTMQTNNEQAAFWNGAAGQAWIDAQQLLDRMFRTFEALLVDEVAAASARRVLDVGCGTGSTTLAIARRVGAAGSCTGVDISEPMISVARDRAEGEGSSARFVVGDAQDLAFGRGSFDMIVSRFGVMFFEDPVAAFVNLRSAAREGGRLRAIVWRSGAENPFMTTAERAAAPLLPELPPRRADGPGQFAFADADRVRGMLEASGWAAVDIRPLDVTCVFPEAELVPYLSRLGPVGLLLRQADEHTRARVIRTVRSAFEPYVFGDEVRLEAACWMVAARSP